MKMTWNLRGIQGLLIDLGKEEMDSSSSPLQVLHDVVLSIVSPFPKPETLPTSCAPASELQQRLAVELSPGGLHDMLPGPSLRCG